MKHYAYPSNENDVANFDRYRSNAQRVRGVPVARALPMIRDSFMVYSTATKTFTPTTQSYWISPLLFNPHENSTPFARNTGPNHTIRQLNNGIVQQYNILISRYLNDLYDPQSRKMYTKGFASFASSGLLDAMNGNGFPDFALFQYPQYETIRNHALAGGPENNYWDRVRTMYENTQTPPAVAQEVLRRHYELPRRNGVLSATLAYVMKTMTSRVHPQSGVKLHEVTNLQSIGSHVLEKYRACAPMHLRIFRAFLKRCRLYKKIISRVTTAPGALDTIITQRFKIGPDTGEAKVVEVDTDPFTVFANPIIDDAITVGANHSEIVGSYLDEIINGLTSLVADITALQTELQETDSTKAVFFDVRKDFTKTFLANEKELPFAAPSVLAMGLGPETRVTRPYFLGGSSQVNNKFAYGIRSVLLTDFDLSRSNKDTTPYFNKLVEDFNAISNRNNDLDITKYDETLRYVGHALNYVYDLRFYNGEISFSAFDELYRPDGDINVQLYQERNSPSDSLALVENISAADSRNKVAEHIKATIELGARAAMHAAAVPDRVNNPRRQVMVINLLDMNIMPINVHALIRDIPLANIYNYAMTFDEYVDRTLPNPQDPPQNVPATLDGAFKQLLKNPYNDAAADMNLANGSQDFRFLDTIIHKDYGKANRNDDAAYRLLCTQRFNTKVIRDLTFLVAAQILIKQNVKTQLEFINTAWVGRLRTYVDVIVKDVKRTRDKDPAQGYSFNFRAAHRALSFSQLLECARQDPELFRSNSEFAVRGMQLLRAAAELDSEQCSDLRSEVQNVKELRHLATYVEFLRDFTSSSVGRIQVMVLYRKLQLLNVVCCTNANAVMELLNSLVDYVKIAGGRTLNSFGYVGSCGFDAVYQANHDEIIRTSLKTLWSSGIDENAVFSALSNYLDNGILNVQHALTMIKCGKGVFSAWTDKLKTNGQNLPSEASAPQLVFCDSNPTYFLPEDPLRIYVRTRNVKSVTAHLYEIKTMEYYSRLRREIKGDICLDGLLPTEEQVVDLSHLTQWQESRVSIEFCATQNSQRGVFVVEVFEKGMTCRAILRKGYLRHVERITAQGHEFTVLDEHGNLLPDARALVLNVKAGGSRAQHGREYSPDDKGRIIIPFRHPNEGSSTDKFAIAFCHGSFGYFHGSFSYLAETFDVSVDIHIDTEQLLPGFIAQLVTRPRLLVAGLATGEPLDLIVDLKVVIEFDLVNTSNVGSSSHKEILSFASMQQIVDDPPCFEIPMDAQSFNVTFEGRVSKPYLNAKIGDLPKVSDSKRFVVQRVNDFDSTYTPHFVRRPLESGDPYSPSEFRVLVLCHNGEPVPNAPAVFFFNHVHHTEEIKVALQTDASGEVNLGQLQDIQQLRVDLGARTGSTRSCSWELPNLRSYRPQIVNCSVEETVEIPIPFAFSTKVEAWVDEKLVLVCEVVDTVLQNAAQFSEVVVIKSKLNYPVSIGVRIAREGKYVVYLRPLNLKYPVTVCQKKNMQVYPPHGLIIQPTQVLLATPTLPLTICSQELKSEDKQNLVLEIQLRNFSRDSTHVLVLLKQFLDLRSKKISEVLVADGLAPVSSSGVRLPKLHFRSSPLENDFLKMRKISDEYAYILQRRALVSSSPNSSLFVGSPLLPKPSLLQNPHVISESDMEVVTVEAGDKVTGFKAVASHEIQSGGERMRISLKSKKRSSRKSYTMHELTPSISFLGKQSQLLVSSVVSPNGSVRIELSGLPFFSSEMGSFEVCTVAFDSESGCVCTQELAMTAPSRDNKLILPKRDIRLSAEEALAPSEHFQQGDSHECIRSGEVKTLPRSFSSKYALYDSLESAINLWPTLTSGSEVSELASKLKEWRNLSLDEKSSFYFVNASDDFHFYLFRKDPDFFRQFAKPLIQAKISKSLVDYYVLGDETSLKKFYLNPAAFHRLSCVEKLLVAERLTDVEARTGVCQAIIREIDSTYPSGCSALSRLFNTVLSQGQVEPSAPPPAPIEPAPGMGFGAAPPDISRYIERAEMMSMPMAAAAPRYAMMQPRRGCGGTFGASPAFGTAAIDSNRDRDTTDVTEVTTGSYLMDADDDFGVRSLDSESDNDDNEEDDGDDDSEEETKQKRKRLKQETPYISPGKVRKVQEKRFFTGQHPALSGRNKF
ncbi:Actin-binding protein F [Phytophthora nicotianae]|nr:Actin-binding protein F [Phytophthora nicotianae]